MNNNNNSSTNLNGVGTSEDTWHRRTVRDYSSDVISKRSSIVPWYRFYLDNMNTQSQRGSTFCFKMQHTILTLLEDSLTTLQDLVLSGDVETAQYQIQRERDRASTFDDEAETVVIKAKNTKPADETQTDDLNIQKPKSKFDLSSNNSLMQFAVVSGNREMIHMLLQEAGTSKRALLNKPDLVTGFTAFHFALFVENKEMMSILIEQGCDVEQKDNYFATAFDYAKMLGILPRHTLISSIPTQIKVWDPTQKAIEQVPVQAFEYQFKVKFTPYIICDQAYIEELLFSGLAIDTVDKEFRAKYLETIHSFSGDDNLILAKVSDTVGWGVFAAKDFQEGDYIVRYGGHLMAADKVKDRSYAMASGVEGMLLDGKKFRNLGGMINHSRTPNAESQCCFDRGTEQAIITATKFIPKGHQILIDYSSNYWTKSALKSKKLEEITAEPLPLP